MIYLYVVNYKYIDQKILIYKYILQILFIKHIVIIEVTRFFKSCDLFFLTNGRKPMKEIVTQVKGYVDDLGMIY